VGRKSDIENNGEGLLERSPSPYPAPRTFLKSTHPEKNKIGNRQKPLDFLAAP
jgi:hypothetical protein